MSKSDRGGWIGRAVIVLFLIASFAVVVYVISHQLGGSGSVPDRTNDEMEVVPS